MNTVYDAPIRPGDFFANSAASNRLMFPIAETELKPLERQQATRHFSRN